MIRNDHLLLEFDGKFPLIHKIILFFMCLNLVHNTKFSEAIEFFTIEIVYWVNVYYFIGMKSSE